MSFTRCIYSISRSRTLISNRNFSVSCIKRSVAVDVKKDEKPVILDEESIKFDKDVNVAGRTERRKAAVPPFVKNFFVAKYDRDLLAYPEIMNHEEFDVLTKHLESVKFSMDNFELEEDIIKSLQAGRIMTAPLSAFHGGLACTLTERLRLLEDIAVNVKVARRVADNWAGLDSIQMSLPSSDLDKVLPGVVEDGRLISMCLSEKMCEEYGKPDFTTKAVMKVDGSWLVSGMKHCVNHDGYKVVLALTPGYKIYPFLVEPNASGISYNSEWVKFDETPAMRLLDSSKEKSIDDMTEDDKMAECLLEPIGRLRLYKSMLACALLKNLILKMIVYVRSKYMGGTSYADFPFAQDKIMEATLTAYTTEAMIYFTAGLNDGYLKPDTNVEMSMCRIYCTERCFESTQQLMSLLNRDLMLPEWNDYYVTMRDLLYEDCENNDALLVYAGSHSIKHAGILMAKDIKMLRNPLFNPFYVFKNAFRNRHHEIDDPQLTIKLEEHLHPSLQLSARNLEYCVHRLQFGCEAMLTRHGTDVTHILREVKRISKVGMEVYAMSAAISRANRAYCTGLANSNCDMTMVPQIIEMGKRRVKELIADVDNGEYGNFDACRSEIGEFALEHNGKLADHSLERNFW